MTPTFDVNVASFSSSLLVKIEVRSEPNQLIRGCITSVSYATLDPISFHLAFLSFLSQSSTHPHWYCVSEYIHLPTLSLLILLELSPSLLPSSQPPPALSVNRQKCVCRPGVGKECRQSNLTWIIIPLIETDQKPIESQSNICISPSSVSFNCQCC